MRHLNHIIALPDYRVKNVICNNPTIYLIEYLGKNPCPECESLEVRKKDSFYRTIRHITILDRPTYWKIWCHKFQCLSCGRYFNSRLPGVLSRHRSTELFRYEIFDKHEMGICQKTISEKYHVSCSTIERWAKDFLNRILQERKTRKVPRVLGIDEHFFSRKKGYSTTLADLRTNRVYDLILGRSEKSVEGYFSKLCDKDRVQVAVMDLSETYRNIIKTYFPRAKIVADRFHVIRLVNHHFMEAWKQLDPIGRKNRGLLSLMRRHEWNLEEIKKNNLDRYLNGNPTLRVIYEFKQKLSRLLLIKHQTKQKCRLLIPQFLDCIEKLLDAPIESLRTILLPYKRFTG